jgi:hypothetical protein
LVIALHNERLLNNYKNKTKAKAKAKAETPVHYFKCRRT